MGITMNNKYAILVLSCDKYSSLWRPFFSQLRKYWPKSPYQLYLGSNTISYRGDRRVKTILSGRYTDWSSNVLSVLNQIPEEYIFVWLDDLFLTQKVRPVLFQKCFRFLHAANANHIHFAPSTPPDGISSNPLFGYYKRRAPYRVSAVGFWKRDHLKQLLLPGEDPWQFEIFGSYRSSYFDGYFCLRKNLFNFIQIVERGKIFREAYDYCTKHGIELDVTGWQIHTRFHKIKSDILRYIFNGIVHIPWKVRLSIMDFFRKALASY